MFNKLDIQRISQISHHTIVVKLAIPCNNDDHKKLTQYLIHENAYVDSTSFKDLEHVRIKVDQKYHGILKNTDHQM